MFTFSVVVVDLPIDSILSFLFPSETDVLFPVLSQSTDVVVVNFVVVLKFPSDFIINCCKGDPITASYASFSQYRANFRLAEKLTTPVEF